MCLPWRFRQLIAIVVVFTSACQGQINEVGKVYPRRNHWAVGHLMGKKSIDNLLVEHNLERDIDMNQPAALVPAAKDRGLDRTLGPSTSTNLWALIRTLLTLEKNVEHVHRKQVQNFLEERRGRWEEAKEEREQHRHLREVADLLLQALVMRETAPAKLSSLKDLPQYNIH